MTPAYSLRIGAAVGLTSLALIQTELLLTRLLSVVVWYHFAFVAISVALFGLGIAALAVHALGARLAPQRTLDYAAIGAAAAAVSVLVVDIALLHAAPDWFGAGASGVFTQPTLKLLLLFVLAALPFCTGGFTIALALARYAREVRRVYFWDLVGAGLGGASVVPLLELVGAPTALLVPAAVCGVAALVLTGVRGHLRWVAAGAIALPLLLAVSAERTHLFEIRIAKGVHLDQLRPELNRWNSFSMVTVLSQSSFRGWAPSNRYIGPLPEQKTLVIDMNAMTPLIRFSGSFDDLAHLSFDLSAFVYRVRPEPERVCVLGAGGGRDVLSALQSGARHVTAVEINPLIVDEVMRGRYRDFTGNLYGRPDVTVAIEDGRSFVARSSQRWDVVHLSMVDTSAATAAGAYALTENSLYTSDAFVELCRHLRPRGVLSVGSVSLPDLAVGARLASTARAALERLGRDPQRGLAVIAAPWLGAPGAVMYDVLVAPDGFDSADAQRILSQAALLGFVPVYVPGAASPELPGEPAQIARLISARDRGELRAALAGPLDVSATSDDRPFFFYQNRLSDLGPALGAGAPAHLFGNGMAILSKLLVVSIVLGLLLVLIPIVIRGSQIRAGTGSALADGAYVACLGFGFMFVEVGLLQRTSLHLGHPTATLTVVLLVLLVAGGIGSWFFARKPAPRRARVVLLCAIVLVLGFAIGGSALLSATRGFGVVGRALVSALLIAPIGLALGAPLPLGLGAVGARAPGRIPWLWAVSGATSVLGSLLATMVGLHFGIVAILLAGAGIYSLALFLSGAVTKLSADRD
jgi:hypothetical protein